MLSRKQFRESSLHCRIAREELCSTLQPFLVAVLTFCRALQDHTGSEQGERANRFGLRGA